MSEDNRVQFVTEEGKGFVALRYFDLEYYFPITGQAGDPQSALDGSRVVRDYLTGIGVTLWWVEPESGQNIGVVGISLRVLKATEVAYFSGAIQVKYSGGAMRDRVITVPPFYIE